MKFNNNLFELDSEQIETSKMMYNGKVIKCLVAPYHSYNTLESDVPYTKTTFLFPERELSAQQVRGFISMVVNLQTDEEIRIITADQTIIGDMIGDCVRILTEAGDIVKTDTKTFAANIHDIRYTVLQNPAHQISQLEKEEHKSKINDIITKINSGKMTEDEAIEARKFVDLIGEDVIRVSLNNMLRDVERKFPPKLAPHLMKKLTDGKMTCSEVQQVLDYIKTVPDSDKVEQLEKLLPLLKSVEYLD